MQLSKKILIFLKLCTVFKAISKKILFFVTFQLFFFINPSFSDHLTVKVSGFQNATSPIYVWGYDRKFYFEEESAPLFMVGERDINNFNRINLKAFPHMVIGLFVYQDLDDNGVFFKRF